MKCFKRIAILALALTLGLSAAAESMAGYISVKKAVVYTDANKTSAAGSLKGGTLVTVEGIVSNVAKITLNGRTGYMDGTQLVLQDACETRYVVANTRVYASPSTSATSRTVRRGAQVRLIEEGGAWGLIEKDGASGYMKLNYLTEKQPLTAEQISTLSANAKDVTVTRSASVYAAPDPEVVSVNVKKGTKIRLLGLSGDWALVSKGSAVGYMDADALTESGTATVAPTATPAPTESTDDTKNAVDAYVNTDSRVFSAPKVSASSVTVKKGTACQLLAVSNGWAMVSKNGKVGYMNAEHVSKVTVTVPDEPVVTAVPTSTPAPLASSYSEYLKDAVDAYVNTDSAVYAAMDVFSSAVEVRGGTAVQLCGVKDGWALVYRNGTFGFMNAGHVSKVNTAATVAPTQTPSVSADYLTSSQYTNEQKCFIFLTREAGLSAAAACGIMANIKYESGYSPTAGSSYYGLCQWGGSRLTRLKNYCSENGYDHTTLKGQLNFLIYEMKNNYSKVYTYVTGVEDTAQGAYDAGYYFCYHYEAPASKESRSATRGGYAKDTLYPRYA